MSSGRTAQLRGSVIASPESRPRSCRQGLRGGWGRHACTAILACLWSRRVSDALGTPCGRRGVGLSSAHEAEGLTETARGQGEPMASDTVRIPAGELEEFAKNVFIKVGLPSEDAALEAEVLVWANLRAVDSHGVLRIPSYVDMVDRGDMNPRPSVRVEKETPATVLVEGARACGAIVTVYTMKRVIEKARRVGIGWGLIRNTTHQGAMAYYALMAAREGMAGIAIVCSPPNMAPHGARAAGVHNSPISIAV